MKLLDFFSERHPAIGLSEMARLAGCDKATTRRLLLALERSGMVEQLLESRKYRLGVAPLRL
ncbi:MAG: helix-turn-helix domain-containing protein, partial [Verrucomicrobiota bacterium]|nr:helix-turn-helix domain-containing protein [Verrucomicrobiota bacterium]